jgi:hypothetical protein
MRRGLGLLILGSTLIVSADARADDANPVGSLVGLEVNTASADAYLAYHGQAFVKNEDGSVEQYRWGGISCGSRVLTDEHLAMLQRALTSKKMTIEPRTQLGQGDAKCLVGFTLAEKKNLGLLP